MQYFPGVFYVESSEITNYHINQKKNDRKLTLLSKFFKNNANDVKN